MINTKTLKKWEKKITTANKKIYSIYKNQQ